MPFKAYYKEIQKNLRTGSTERSYYSALKLLLEALNPKLDVFTEHGHIEVGHPDFEVRLKPKAADFPIGWIEAKTPSDNLDKTEKSEQLKRYRGLHNLVLTDFIEFRLYQNGKRILTARLGTVQKKKLKVDPKGEAAVRQLLTQFLTSEFAPPRNPKELALRMAPLTHIIRDVTLQTYHLENESDDLHAQLEAFRTTLIPDLKPEQFADMYAQTIAYGLFAAACQPRRPTEKFTREKAAYLIPKTNPFLRKLFSHIAGPDMDERILPFVDHLVSLLRKADLDTVLQEFGKRTGKEDPVVHFYEDFLLEYDPKVRKMRGVYYTPEPVVLYIVRSIDHLLKTRFNKPDGLADKNVFILDPACGTGTFLYHVIRHIHDTLSAKGQKGAWNTYVSQNLLKRIFGFELLMAPYAVAHLKLSLLLKELGYRFDTDERLGIYLTNTLEEAIKKSEIIFAQWIADEANAAAEIKRDKPIMVVLGNPPYSGISANKGKWIDGLLKGTLPDGEIVASYYEVDEKPLAEKKHWLQDDYVKFIRFAQWRINRTGHGILGFITNHGYLDNPTFRGMRQQLLNEFTDIFILDLHGNIKKKERAPDGSKDENVFDIQQGVAIGLYIKEVRRNTSYEAKYSELWGLRSHKNTYLFNSDVKSVSWINLKPGSPYYFFVPRNEAFREEYDRGWKITEVFSVNTTGIVTARDAFVMDYETGTLIKRIGDLHTKELSDEEIRTKYFGHQRTSKYLPGDTRGWKLPEARKKVRSDPDWTARVKPYLYRPFDIRPLYYVPWMVDWPRPEVMRHMVERSTIALLWTRPMSPKFEFSVLCTRHLMDQCVVGNKSAGAGISYIGPLYLSPDRRGRYTLLDTQPVASTSHKDTPNLNPTFTGKLQHKAGAEIHP